MRWREKIAGVAGLPPLGLMEGFFERNSPYDPFKHMEPNSAESYYSCLPIKWDALKIAPALQVLLSHSDCEGDIPAEVCGPVAEELEKLLPLIDGDGGGHIGLFREKTQTFIDGLKSAAKAGEAVEFH